MNTKKIIANLKQIGEIAKFQQERILDKEAVNKDLILFNAMIFVTKHAQIISQEVE